MVGIFPAVLFLVINVHCLTAQEVPTTSAEHAEILIMEGPEDYEAIVRSQAHFDCYRKFGSGDFKVSWKQNGQKIDFENKPRFVLTSDNSLRIYNISEWDSGTYTCVVETKQGEAEASAYLIVQDVPNPPELTRVECSEKSATVYWTPMGDNRAPILHYEIQYNTTFYPDRWETIAQVPYGRNYNVTMSPWGNYTFRVKAVNKVGPSKPSYFSDMCITSPDVPYQNPNIVKVEGTQPGNLVISWMKMRPIEHNGPGFHYRVFWKRDSVDAIYQTRDVEDWETEQITIDDLPESIQYLIKVVALNDLGVANVEPREVVGFSGKAI